MEELLPRPEPPASPGERVRSLAALAVERLRWFGVGRLAAIVVSVVLVVAGATWLLAPPPPPVEASLPMTVGDGAASSPGPGDGAGALPGTATSGPGVAGAASLPPSTPAPSTVVVHVAGAVLVPGVHELPAGARVADAVAAAGGAAPGAHTDAVNLAAPVHDGDRVYVPALGDEVVVPAGVTPATSAVPPVGAGSVAGPVSINAAGADELDALPGVGPATAAAIVAHREAYGPFASIDALADVRGIGPAKLEALRPLVVL